MKSDHESLMDERVQSAKLCCENETLRALNIECSRLASEKAAELTTLKAKLEEVEDVLAWATVNIRDLSNFRWIVSDDLNWSVTTKDYQSFTEPTLYEALKKAWEAREK